MSSSSVPGDCPADIEVDADSSGNAVVSWAEPTVSDNQCGATIARVTDDLPANGNTWRAGSFTVRYEAKDLSNNRSPCEFKVVVKDVHAPVFTNCPTSLKIFTQPGAKVGVVAFPVISARDTSDSADPTITFSPFNINGYAIRPGIVEVTVTATDKSGNQDTCEFVVEVEDNEKPWDSHVCPIDGAPGVANGQQCGGKEVPVTARSSDLKLTLGTPTEFAVQACCTAASTCTDQGASGKYSVCK